VKVKRDSDFETKYTTYDADKGSAKNMTLKRTRQSDHSYHDQELRRPLHETVKVVHDVLLNKVPPLKNFVTVQLLSRPPFPFIHSVIVTIINYFSGDEDQPRFGNKLFSEKELEHDFAGCNNKREKIRFLTKILAYVSILSGVNIDIYVSPVKVLSGKEVSATLLFLKLTAIYASIQDPCKLSHAESFVNTMDCSELYKRAVRSRSLLVKVQALARGRKVRKCTKRPRKGVMQTSTSPKTRKVGNNEKDPTSENCPQQLSRKPQPFIGPPFSAPELHLDSCTTQESMISPSSVSLPPLAFRTKKNQENNRNRIEGDFCNGDLSSKQVMKLYIDIETKIRTLNCKETDLREREVFLQLKEERVSKLADSLRRQKSVLLSKRKEKKEADIKREDKVIIQEECKRDVPYSKVSQNEIDFLVKRKIKKIEQGFREKEIDLVQKEERLNRLAQNLQKQHKRIISKQRKLDLKETKLSLRAAMGSSLNEPETHEVAKPVKTLGFKNSVTQTPHKVAAKVFKKRERNKSGFRKQMDEENFLLGSSSILEKRHHEDFSNLSSRGPLSQNERNPRATCSETRSQTRIDKRMNKNMIRVQNICNIEKSNLKESSRERKDNDSTNKKTLNAFIPRARKEKRLRLRNTQSESKNNSSNKEFKKKEKCSNDCHMRSYDRNFFVSETKLKKKKKDTNDFAKTLYDSCEKESKELSPHEDAITRRQSTKTITKSKASTIYQSYKFSFERRDDKESKPQRARIQSPCSDSLTKNVEWNKAFKDELNNTLLFCPGF